VKQPKGGLAGWRCFSFAFVKDSQTALPTVFLFVYQGVTYAMEVSRNGCSQRFSALRCWGIQSTNVQFSTNAQ